jgi:hypothetical protein
MCIVVIATEFYIGNTIDDIERLKVKFGVEGDLTLEEEEALVLGLMMVQLKLSLRKKESHKFI